MAEGKNAILVYRDWINIFSPLSDDEAGKLIKHFFEYVNDHNPDPPDRLTELLFSQIKSTLKRDLKKWESKSKKNRENALKRWDANASERKKNSANHADSDNDSVNDNDNDKEVNNMDFDDSDLKLLKFLSAKLNVDPNLNAHRYEQIVGIVKYFKGGPLDLDRQFRDQVFYYFRYKSYLQEKIHGFDKFFGSEEKGYIDGAWNDHNWKSKYEGLFMEKKGTYPGVHPAFQKR